MEDGWLQIQSTIDMSENTKIDKLSLVPFMPEQYHNWASACNLTFRVHKLYDIVRGLDPHPLPQAASFPISLRDGEVWSQESAQLLLNEQTLATKKQIEKGRKRIFERRKHLSKRQSLHRHIRKSAK